MTRRWGADDLLDLVLDAGEIDRGIATHAAEMAAAQRVRARDLLEIGTVHLVVPEVDGESARDLARAVAAECGAVLRESSPAHRSEV